jgi:hypothetical protein
MGVGQGANTSHYNMWHHAKCFAGLDCSVVPKQQNRTLGVKIGRKRNAWDHSIEGREILK